MFDCPLDVLVRLAVRTGCACGGAICAYGGAPCAYMGVTCTCGCAYVMAIHMKYVYYRFSCLEMVQNCRTHAVCKDPMVCTNGCVLFCLTFRGYIYQKNQINTSLNFKLWQLTYSIVWNVDSDL